MNKNFESYLCDRNDDIDNAAHALLNAIAKNGEDSDKSIEWDMSKIGPLVDAAENILEKNGVKTCHPFYEEDDIPCINGEDCKNPFCIFRDNKDTEDKSE
jgi:hypothetical protein